MADKINFSRIYLASRNPRRRELLAQIGAQFDNIVFRSFAREIDDTRRAGESPSVYVERVARAKAERAWRIVVERKLLRQPVLAANTIVEIDGRIIGKPVDEDDAKKNLRRLSGKHHRVLTAVAVVCGNRVATRLSVSEVFFAPLAETQINDYVASGEALAKAGAYGIHGRAGQFVEHLAGSYSGVLGLPLFETAELLRDFGYPI
jgi:septum formation protein